MKTQLFGPTIIPYILYIYSFLTVLMKNLVKYGSKELQNRELPSCRPVLNQSWVGIRNCTKPQLGTRTGFKVDTHVHKNQIFGSDIWPWLSKKTIYPVIIYNHGSQIFFWQSHRKCLKNCQALLILSRTLTVLWFFFEIPGIDGFFILIFSNSPNWRLVQKSKTLTPHFLKLWFVPFFVVMGGDLKSIIYY
jgi:hypothetical protein